MSLVIRMARAGTKKRPFYHIVLADSRSPRDGRFIERLGYFNPLLPKERTERLKLDLDKVQAWMKKGAQPSDRVIALPRRRRHPEAREAQQSDQGRAAQGTQGRSPKKRSRPRKKPPPQAAKAKAQRKGRRRQGSRRRAAK